MPTKTFTVTQVDALQQRPTVTPNGHAIPADWLIFNAPRPLVGSEPPDHKANGNDFLEWNGEWVRGLYFAAVNPKDPLAAHQVKQNVDLDAYLVRYMTEADVRAWFHRYYVDTLQQECGEELPLESSFTWRDILDTYRQLYEHSKVNIEVEGEDD